MPNCARPKGDVGGDAANRGPGASGQPVKDVRAPARLRSPVRVRLALMC